MEYLTEERAKATLRKLSAGDPARRRPTSATTNKANDGGTGAYRSASVGLLTAKGGNDGPSGIGNSVPNGITKPAYQLPIPPVSNQIPSCNNTSVVHEKPRSFQMPLDLARASGTTMKLPSSYGNTEDSMTYQKKSPKLNAEMLQPLREVIRSEFQVLHEDIRKCQRDIVGIRNDLDMVLAELRGDKPRNVDFSGVICEIQKVKTEIDFSQVVGMIQDSRAENDFASLRKEIMDIQVELDKSRNDLQAKTANGCSEILGSIRSMKIELDPSQVIEEIRSVKCEVKNINTSVGNIKAEGEANNLNTEQLRNIQTEVDMIKNGISGFSACCIGSRGRREPPTAN